MTLISLSFGDLLLAMLLIVLLAGLSFKQQLGIEKRLLIAALRAVVQLSLLGLVLKLVFNQSNMVIIALLALFMLLFAGYEVMNRQQRPFKGYWRLGIGTLSMFISTFSITLLALLISIQPQPWYTPQYLIPLLGMLLGNTMTGVSLSLDTLNQQAWQQRRLIEARLMLGADWPTAILPIRRNALRTGLIPIMNAMAAAGVVSIPGMMTGQILAGAPPMEAAKYQILILILVAASVGLGAMAAVWLGSRRLFDERHRLRLDRLENKLTRN